MIVMMQIDEPNQKNCIYKLSTKVQVAGAVRKQEKLIEKYF